MTLSTDNRTPAGDSGAGASLGTGANAGPAQPEYMVGSIQFRNAQLPPDVADEVMTMMADSIVRLQFEADELRAEVALLREERNILARAKAAVTEGGTGYSGVERPEPPPHLSDVRESCRDKAAADRVGGHEWGNI